MLHQVGLNHILDDGTICYCLICKDSIAEKYSLNRDKAIRHHLRSEGHEESTRNLFKMCILDPKCESRNIKYLDIVNNSEFDVWEQGLEPSYVSKKDNHFVCLICKEEVSKVYGEVNKIKYNFKTHLGSELHLDNVKTSIWWTYHPNLDTNYIALNNIIMYCSFCQKFLKSKENSLLEFASNHIETELTKINSDIASKINLLAINSDNSSKTELEDTSSDDSKIEIDETTSENNFKIELKETNSSARPEVKIQDTFSDSDSKAELDETSSSDTSGTQFVPGLKPIISKSRSMTKHTQNATSQSVEISQNLKTIVDNVNKITIAGKTNETSLDEIANKLKIFNKSLDYDGFSCSLINDMFNNEELICQKCHEQVEVFNDDISFSMLQHSQKHKDLNLSYDNIELEIQEKSGIECEICHKPIEVFNKDTAFSYYHHLGNCHPGVNPVVNIENVNIDSTGYQQSKGEANLIAKVFSLLPQSLRDHLNFVDLNGENLNCILCNCELSSSNDVTIACDILQNHFSEFFHISQYNVCTQKEVNHSNDQELEIHDQIFKGLQFNRSTMSQKENPGMLVKNVNLGQFNANEITPEVTVRSRSAVQGILHRLVNKHPLVGDSKHILDEKKGHFYCQLCYEVIKCTRSGSELIKHLNGERHLTKLKSGLIKQSKGKVRTQAQVLQILNELLSRNRVISQNIDNVREKDGRFFCIPCNEVIMCTLSGKKLIDHLTGLGHGLQMERLTDEQRQVRWKTRPADQVLNMLLLLASRKREVGENIEVLGEKQGNFYCEVCDEILLCTCSGKALIEHLRDKKHVFNFLSHTSKL